MLYCPSCLNQTLDLNQKGVVHIVFNGVQIETGRFLFNQDREDPEVIYQNCKKKLDDYFKWYKTLRRQDPVKKIQLMSSDFHCSNGCKMQLNLRFTIVDVLVPVTLIQEQINELAQKHLVTVEFNLEEEY